MVVQTRAQKLKAQQQKTNMEETNTYENPWPIETIRSSRQSMDDEPTKVEIKKAMKDPRFQKTMKMIINLDKE